MQTEQAGRGDGEPHKILNARYGTLGRRIIYMTRMNCQVRLFLLQPSLCTGNAQCHSCRFAQWKTSHQHNSASHARLKSAALSYKEQGAL